MIDAKGRHTEAYPRLLLADSIVKVADEEIDIVPAPVCNIAKAARISLEGVGVGNIHATDGVRVKIVVHVDAVDVVVSQNVLDDIDDMLTVDG